MDLGWQFFGWWPNEWERVALVLTDWSNDWETEAIDLALVNGWQPEAVWNLDVDEYPIWHERSMILLRKKAEAVRKSR